MHGSTPLFHFRPISHHLIPAQGAADKECTHSPLYTTSHLSRGNWKGEEKGRERGEVRRTADEGVKRTERRGGQRFAGKHISPVNMSPRLRLEMGGGPHGIGLDKE